MKKLLWWLIAGTKGGSNRAKIIHMLHDLPRNANQIADELKLDYKTVRHHLKILEENGILISSGNKQYGAVYFLSAKMEDNIELFMEIWEKIGKKKLRNE